MTVQEMLMARPGRKTKAGARYKCGKRKQEAQPNDYGTEEFRAHRRNLVGARYATDQRAGDALGVLELAGLITASQREAGAAWGAAMRATYGSPLPKGARLDSMPGGHSDGPSAGMQRKADVGIDSIRYAAGHDGYHWCRLVCVADRLPGWFKRDYPRESDAKQLASFQAGMVALENST